MRFFFFFFLVVKASASRAAVLCSIPAVTVYRSPGRVIPVNSNMALHWLPCQAPGVTGSATGLVSQVSVYCNWVR